MFHRRLIIATVVLLAGALLLTACASGERIVILDNPDGTGFSMDFSKFSGSSKCQLSLTAGDVVQVEVARTGGQIGLTVTGLKGSEPYIGSDLPARTFTFSVAETDEYVFRITGKNATGQIIAKNISRAEDRD